MGKAIRTEYINDKTHLSECHDGYWLYDENRGMNLAIRAESEKAALIEALEYYQEKAIALEAKNKHLNNSINAALIALGADGQDDFRTSIFSTSCPGSKSIIPGKVVPVCVCQK